MQFCVIYKAVLSFTLEMKESEFVNKLIETAEELRKPADKLIVMLTQYNLIKSYFLTECCFFVYQ